MVDRLLVSNYGLDRRLQRDTVMLRMATVLAELGTCSRRRVGCILTNSKGRIISAGYNGPPSGHPHCTARPCPGAKAPPGESLNLCEAVHAEANAILGCADRASIHTCYSVVSPCLDCVKLLLTTSCARIVFISQYAHDTMARERWLRLGVHTWEQLDAV